MTRSDAIRTRSRHPALKKWKTDGHGLIGPVSWPDIRAKQDGNPCHASLRDMLQ